MKTSPWLMAAGLLFWAWQTGLWIVGIGMAVILESSRLMTWRLNFSPREYRRVWDFTNVMFVAAALFAYATYDVAAAVISFIQWLPLIFFPFMAAQAFGSQDLLGATTFFWLLRRQRRADPPGSGVNVSYPYFGLCLLSASATPAGGGERYFVGICLLIGFGIWLERPRRTAGWVTVATLAGVAAASFFVQAHMRDLQSSFERASAQWLAAFFRRESGEFEMQTAIGRLGSLRLSGRVVLRVEPHDADRPPRYLRQASFNGFRINSWYSRRRSFMPVREFSDGDWNLIPGTSVADSVMISCYLPEGRGILALPGGTKRVGGLPAGDMEYNRFGVVRVSHAADAARYEAYYGGHGTIDGPPEEADRLVPPDEKDVIAAVVQELALAGRSPGEMLERVTAYFDKHFRYTTDLGPGRTRRTSAGTPLGRFLTQNRQGHCEYFASAAALILRQAGLSTRYAAGYRVDPEARESGTYVIRERHGHAWVLVYLDGEWRDYDPTPAGASPVSFGEALWETISGWWTQFWLLASTGRLLDDKSVLIIPFAAVGFLLAASLVWGFVGRKKAALVTVARSGILAKVAWPGWDSELFLVERRLATLGLVRQPDETLRQWSRRIAAKAVRPSDAREWQELVELHYRLRFDPAGLPPADRAELGARARRWLERPLETG